MIYKWKHNYTDEEKGMALTIQNLKQEIDKLVDANEDINREFSQYKYESKKEIERLNNIINDLERYINEEYIYDELGMKIFDASKLQDKLQELKGSDK